MDSKKLEGCLACYLTTPNYTRCNQPENHTQLDLLTGLLIKAATPSLSGDTQAGHPGHLKTGRRDN